MHYDGHYFAYIQIAQLVPFGMFAPIIKVFLPRARSVVSVRLELLLSAIMPVYVGQNKGIITNLGAATNEILTIAPSTGNA